MLLCCFFLPFKLMIAKLKIFKVNAVDVLTDNHDDYGEIENYY